MQSLLAPDRPAQLASLISALRQTLDFVLRLFALWPWLARTRGFARYAAYAEDRAEKLIFVAAMLEVAPLLDTEARIAAARSRRPASAPRGFRRVASHARPFQRRAGVRLKSGDVAARIARLAGVLAAPARCVARIVKRLLQRRIGARLVAAAPPALALTACAPVFAPEAADSS